jgi:hypothetical protein
MCVQLLCCDVEVQYRLVTDFINTSSLHLPIGATSRATLTSAEFLSIVKYNMTCISVLLVSGMP